MTIALDLARYVRETAALPASTRTAAATCVFDLLAAAVAGYESRAAVAARRAAVAAWGEGGSAIWFSDRRSTSRGAVFANAAAASALDLDDGHRGAAGHPGAAIIPAVLAEADAHGLDGEAALTAITLGYEIGIRISAARDIRSIPTTDSGLWCGQGVAAAIGWLRGLAAEEIAHAIAIAGTTAPAQAATPYTRLMGNAVKEGIPWAAANGLLAVDLASQGMTGPIDILDEPSRFDPARLVGDLGRGWAIESVYFKPYSCCRWIHAAIDAVLMLVADHGIVAEAIHSIEVETFARALTLNNEAAPSTLESAQYSLPFCVGVACHHGSDAFLPLRDGHLSNGAALRTATKVRLSIDPRFDEMFPAAVPARVRMSTGAGTFEREVLLPKGEPRNPMSWTEIGTKFATLAGSRLSPEEARRLAYAASRLQEADIAPLRAALMRSRFTGKAPSPTSVDHAHLGMKFAAGEQPIPELASIGRIAL